jgi:hypothetical protein
MLGQGSSGGGTDGEERWIRAPGVRGDSRCEGRWCSLQWKDEVSQLEGHSVDAGQDKMEVPMSIWGQSGGPQEDLANLDEHQHCGRLRPALSTVSRPPVFLCAEPDPALLTGPKFSARSTSPAAFIAFKVLQPPQAGCDTVTDQRGKGLTAPLQGIWAPCGSCRGHFDTLLISSNTKVLLTAFARSASTWELPAFCICLCVSPPLPQL